MASNVSAMTDRLATERWINEGGHLAPESVIERELRSLDHRRTARRRGRARPRVLIAGGGVAGLETLLALRSLAGDRVSITLVTPERRFVNRSMAIDQLFGAPRAHSVGMQDVTDDCGARWHRGSVDRVEHERRSVVMEDGDELGYDLLVLALGARRGRQSHPQDVLTFRFGAMGPAIGSSSATSAKDGSADWRSSSPPGRPGRCRSTTWH